MPGKNLPYSTDNKLDHFIRVKQAERTLKGERILIKDIRQEITEHCQIVDITLTKIIAKQNQPSLPLALKICEYLGEPLDKVFWLKKE